MKMRAILLVGQNAKMDDRKSGVGPPQSITLARRSQRSRKPPRLWTARGPTPLFGGQKCRV
jgi:hypothetical protein